ncbi:TSUP family transporter [Metaplanococcus flavidus]|uniref:Probable membrane transporter protein n=1 Tax=Metaplanococcus flavidus TaxID=569883 RepID=A0ABW3LAU7_9BACL
MKRGDGDGFHSYVFHWLNRDDFGDPCGRWRIDQPSGDAVTYTLAGNIIWPLTIALVLGSITGAQAGVRIAEKLNPKFVKPLLRAVTVLLIAQILFTRVF